MSHRPTTFFLKQLAAALGILFQIIFINICSYLFLNPIAYAQYFSLGKGQAPIEPYDIDYSTLAPRSTYLEGIDKLHYLPLWSSAYVSVGGELREQAWSLNNASYALRAPSQNTYDLQRVLANAYVHFDDHLAIFSQVGRFDSIARINPSTTERDEGRLQQGFFEVKEKIGSMSLTVRGGRQEIALGSGRFVWLNDSSNLRTTHDGVRASLKVANGSTADVIFTRPVTSVFQPFEDFDTHSGTFGAAYLSQHLAANAVHIDEYFFYRRNIAAQYVGLTGNEDRETVGGRLWGEAGPLLYDVDLAYQFGTYVQKEISAFGGSGRALYQIQQLSWLPALQIQASYFSGGSPNSKTIGTFSAPFPRPTMLNYIGLNTLENLAEIYPAFVLNPSSNVAFRLGPEFVWRASVNDAVYISRTTPLPGTISATDKASFIGTNLVATIQWRPLTDVLLFAEYVHELPGPAITLAGGKAVDAGVLQVSYRF